MVENMDLLGYNFMTNYWQWMRRYGAIYFVGLWMADNMGMMSNCNEAYASLEQQNPIYTESS